MHFFVASILCLVAILAITLTSADAGWLKGASKPKKSVSLTSGAWINSYNEGSTTYIKFNEDNTYNQVEVSNADGKGIDCSNHLTGIYNRMNEEKNPSILDLSFPYMMSIRPFGKGIALPTRFLFYETSKKGKKFSLGFVSEASYNLTFKSVESMPKCPPVLRATVTWVAEAPIQSDKPLLTWMGPDVGLYVSSKVAKVNQHDHGNGEIDDDIRYYGEGGYRDKLLTVVSEADGHTIDLLPDVYPISMTDQNNGCDYPFVVASFGDIFWTSSWCGDENELFQSNADSPEIKLPGPVNGAVALSESILFVQYSRSIAKINVTSNEILATKQGGGIESGDLALSSDRSVVYYIDNESRLVALNVADLSVKCTYAIDVPTGYVVRDYRTILEVTPTNFWIGLTVGSADDGDDDGDRSIYLAKLEFSDAN